MRLTLAVTLAAAVVVASGCNPVVRAFGSGGSPNGGSTTGPGPSGSGGLTTAASSGSGAMGGAGGAGATTSVASSTSAASSATSSVASSAVSSVASSAASSSSSGGGTYCAPPLAPIAQWLFSGNTLDTSGNGHDGTIAGGVLLASDRDNVPNAAYHFDGTDGLINVPDAPALSGMATLTVSAWVYADNMPNSDYVVYKQNGGFSPGYTLRASGSQWLFGVGPSDVYAQAPTAAAVGVWTQLVGTFDGTAITLYLNGAAVASKPSTMPPGSNTEVLTISGSPYYFSGRIDDVRIYACAMSASQVAAAYDP